MQGAVRCTGGGALCADQGRGDERLVRDGVDVHAAQQLWPDRHALLRRPRLRAELALQQRLDQGCAPSDGGEDSNSSGDQGGVGADQGRAARTGMALLMLSAGVPMMGGGDVALRTLFGNNTPCNLDSPANWLAWTRSAREQEQQIFTSRLIAFRRSHPALRPTGFSPSVDTNGNGVEQLRWFRPDGAQADATCFNSSSNHALAWRIDGSEFGDPASALYVAYNGWSDPVNFNLPWPGNGRQWYRVTDTATWNEGVNAFVAPGAEAYIGGEYTVYGLQARSLLLLIAK